MFHLVVSPAQESNLIAVCKAVGMVMVSPPGVEAAFGGDYSLLSEQRAAIVAAVRRALTLGSPRLEEA